MSDSDSKHGMDVTEEELKSAKNLGDLLKGTGLFEQTVHEEFLGSLPAPVKRRLRALKKLQLGGIKLEADFYKRVHDLECDFASRFQQLHDKRRDIISGTTEPSDAEVDYPLVHGLSDEDHAQLMAGGDQNGTDAKGIPNFWLTLFKNVELLAEMIQEHDEPILQHLTDISVEMNSNPTGFTLFFHFSPNEYFTNKELTKQYTLKCDPDEDDPFEYDGPEIVACKGSKVDWKEGKNVTVKLIKKKQKHKATGGTRFVTKQVKSDSFFNFFDPPANAPEDEASLDEETRMLLHADFEVGQALRDRIIPRAVLYYTGEANDEESFDDEDECEDEADDDEEEGEDTDDAE